MQAAQGAASTCDQQSDAQSHRHLTEEADEESLAPVPVKGKQLCGVSALHVARIDTVDLDEALVPEQEL